MRASLHANHNGLLSDQDGTPYLVQNGRAYMGTGGHLQAMLPGHISEADPGHNLDISLTLPPADWERMSVEFDARNLTPLLPCGRPRPPLVYHNDPMLPLFVADMYGTARQAIEINLGLATDKQLMMALAVTNLSPLLIHCSGNTSSRSKIDKAYAAACHSPRPTVFLVGSEYDITWLSDITKAVMPDAPQAQRAFAFTSQYTNRILCNDGETSAIPNGGLVRLDP